MFHLFAHLIVMANHKDQEWKGIMIKRGQLVTGRFVLSKQTGISQRSIRTCLARLEQTGEIVVKSTNKFSIVTICKYDDYQDKKRASDQQATSKRPASDQQATTNNNENNVTRKDTMSGSTLPDSAPPVSPSLKNGVPYSEIVNHLNATAGTFFKPSTRSTKEKIKARWQEGHRLDDFLAVVDHKCEEWLGDDKMGKFLRPETLFGTKFESYLVAAKSAGVGVKPKKRWQA